MENKEMKVTYLETIDYIINTFGEQMEPIHKEKMVSLRQTYQNKKDYKPKEIKLSASVVANAKLKEDIVNTMEIGKEYLVTEIMELVPSIKADTTITSNKISQLLYQLRKEEKVNRVEKKRKAYYSLVVGNAE